MTHKLQKIKVEHLKFGMYVSQLDRPWLETNFLFQGFHIRTLEDIQKLRNYCDHVYVDPEKGVAVPRNLEISTRLDEEQLTRIFLSPCGDKRYPIVTPVEEELKIARKSYDNALNLVSDITERICKGTRLKADPIRKTLNSTIESILRNPDAFMWMKQLKDKDSYTYRHCVDASALAIAFGRHLGLSKPNLENLAIGTLLFDIGKLQLPDELLNKPTKLTSREYELIKRHVHIGAELVSDMEGSNKEIITLVMHHHERHDGKGYPCGISGNRISINGRIASLVDCYDAITSDRPYRAALASYEAIQQIYSCRNKDFQAEMVEQFIQCIGLYPPGTVVELNTGEVAIVIAQNRTNRLHPRVMLILDKDKKPYDRNAILNLADKPRSKFGIFVEIKKPLPPKAYGIEPKEYYI